MSEKRRMIDIIRAKSKKDEHYLLKEHIKDTLERAIQIWEFVNRNKENIEYSKIKSQKTFKDLAKALLLHDLGKIDYGFQKRVFDKDERDDENEDWVEIKRFFTPKGKKYPVDFGVQDHEILSVIHTTVFLGNDDDEKIRTAILLHHYNKYFVEREQHITRILDDYPGVKDYISFMIQSREEFEHFYLDLLEYLNHEFKNRENAEFIVGALKELKTINFEKMDELQRQIGLGFGVSQVLSLYDLFSKDEDETLDFFVFLGLLRRCDYSASAGPEVNAEKPYSIIGEIMDDIPEKIKSKLHLDRMWQEEIVKHHRDKDDIVLIAPTGSGKTEFALLWAREKGKKLLYTLPLRVALNDLFIRFSGKEGYFEKEYVDLLHSTAFIEYLKGESKGEDISIGAKLKEVRLFASPILLTTPDQVFLSSLKYYGFDKLLSLYPTSTVVIDEIQAYDPEMAAIIIKTLQMIKKVRGNILIITATFPPYFDSFLVVDDSEINLKKIDLKVEKQRISQNIKNYDVKRHKIFLKNGSFVRYEYEKDDNGKYFVNVDVEKINEIINSDAHRNDNVLIIVNNVMKAIELYRKCKETYQDHVELLHSRLMEREKRDRVTRIKRFLKDKKEGKIPEEERIITISTQLVEASVDFDFDVLITEISPMDSQVQRWGRIYRNRGNLPYDKDVPNIYIFTDVDVGTSAIYHPKEVLEKTKEIIQPEVGRLLGYEDERRMIEEVYNMSEIRNMYEKRIKETLEWLDYYQASKKSDAQRIFRKLAGMQLIIPQLMIEFGENEKIRKLGERLTNNIYYESWKELTEDIFSEGYSPEDKLRILQWVYEYSIPVPEYAIHGYLEGHTREFLRFHILDIKDERVQEIKDYGIDVVKNQDLDEWLEERSRFI